MNQREMELYREKSGTLLVAARDMSKLCEEMNMTEQSAKMDEVAQQLESHRFSVGIMGEFRRGKSTLINSLLGEKVMPSDIRPCSATMNKVTYGEDKRATIFMKDGQQENIGIDELPRYVTKLEEYEGMAANVDEAVVYYPTDFCREGVDIIDTPGLNDDERMNKVSEEIVPKLDVLIMTLVPDSPLSISEARFIRDTLLTNDLSRMIFLVNKIDTVDEDERELLLRTTRDRIEVKVLGEMSNLVGKDSEVYQKAKKVLNNIHLYGISAKNSLKGKLKNNPVLVEESGAVEFENALTQMLTGERAALELGHATSLLYSSGMQVERELAARRDALNMSKEEFERKQVALEAAKKKTLTEEKQKVKGLSANEAKLKKELLVKAEAHYGVMEIKLHDMVDEQAATWDMKRMGDEKYQALVAGKTQAIVQDAINEQMKGFTVETIQEMQDSIGEDAKAISEFTSESEHLLKNAVHNTEGGKIMDTGDVAATVIDVITDFAGIYGVGGIIAGARAAGLKGAVVGGGIGLVSTLAIAAVCPVAGIPMLIISCAGGTLASKFATRRIFAPDIAKKKRDELVISLKKSITDTIQQLKEEKQLEKWVGSQVINAYCNLRDVMERECNRIINEATASLEELDKVRRTAEEEQAKQSRLFDEQQARCAEILESIKPIADWLGEKSREIPA